MIEAKTALSTLPTCLYDGLYLALSHHIRALAPRSWAASCVPALNPDMNGKPKAFFAYLGCTSTRYTIPRRYCAVLWCCNIYVYDMRNLCHATSYACCGVNMVQCHAVLCSTMLWYTRACRVLCKSNKSKVLFYLADSQNANGDRDANEGPKRHRPGQVKFRVHILRTTKCVADCC